MEGLSGRPTSQARQRRTFYSTFQATRTGGSANLGQMDRSRGRWPETPVALARCGMAVHSGYSTSTEVARPTFFSIFQEMETGGSDHSTAINWRGILQETQGALEAR